MTHDAWDDETATHRLVCIHVGPDPAAWFADQVRELDALACRARPLDRSGPAAVDAWVADVSSDLAALGTEPVHLIATGGAAYGAIALAAQHPEMLVSLVLGDPEVDLGAPGYRELLGRVVAPSLVIASVPDRRVDIAQPQSIAGGIDNGVFVVIDGGTVPAHRERAASFNEWVTAFTIIAEGLDAMASQRQEKASV